MKLKKFKRKDLIFALIGSFFVFLFYMFSKLVRRDFLVNFDFGMTVRIQNHIPPKYDPYFSLLSLIGSFEVIAVVLVLLLIFRRRILGVFVFFLFGFAHVLEIYGKAFLDQHGTPFMFHRTQSPFLFPSAYVQPGYSYPSGHAFRAVFLLVIVLGILLFSKISKNKKIIITCFLFLFAFLMLLSRVSLGEHWTTDVIGGSFLGLGFSLISLIFL